MRNTNIYLGWLVSLSGIFISPDLTAQSPDPLDLMRRYSTLLESIENTIHLDSMVSLRNTEKEVWVVGYTNETEPEVQLISGALPNSVVQVGEAEGLGHLLPGLDETADYQAYDNELLWRKQKLKDLVGDAGKQGLVLFTQLGQAREGQLANGQLSLGNFLEVLGKAQGFKTRNIGILSSSTSGLGGLTSFFKSARAGEVWLVDAFRLRNHVTAGHLNGDFLMLRSLVLRFDYLIFVYKTPASQ